MLKKKDKMNYQKCYGCEFFANTSRFEGLVEFICLITGEQLCLTSCVHRRVTKKGDETDNIDSLADKVMSLIDKRTRCIKNNV